MVDFCLAAPKMGVACPYSNAARFAQLFMCYSQRHTLAACLPLYHGLAGGYMLVHSVALPSAGVSYH